MKFIIIYSLFLQLASGLFVTVPTGMVCAWYRFGALQKELSPPGIHFYNPTTTGFQLVDINSQKDTVSTECVSSDKQVVHFTKIMVWNQLPAEKTYEVLKKYDKPKLGISYDRSLIVEPTITLIKEKCSEFTAEELRSDKYKQLNEMIMDYLVEYQKNRPELQGQSTGVKILKVFVEIPHLSDEVERNYAKIAIEKTAKQAEAYRQETEKKKKETENMLDELEALKKLAVAATENRQAIEKEEADAKKAKIQAESDAEIKRLNADAESYANWKKAADNRELLTAEYLQLKQFETYGCNTEKIYFGEKIPNFLPSSAAAA